MKKILLLFITLINLSVLGQTSQVTTLAGSSQGYLDGSGISARFYDPLGMAISSNGDIYIADSKNHRIRKITPSGNVSTFAGSTQGFADGPLGTALFNEPFDLIFDADGNLFVSDFGNHKIRKITPSGVVSTIAGSSLGFGFSDGTGSAARFNNPGGIALDLNGDLILADIGNHRIRRITQAGVVTTIAGNSSSGNTDGALNVAQFFYPRDVTVGNDGSIYIADTFNERIRKITTTGVVSTLAGSTMGMADGQGISARLSSPYSIAVDNNNNLYVADFGNHRIRKINSSGFVSTLSGSIDGFLDGTASNARFNGPIGVTNDSNGNIFVSEFFNDKIRKITPELAGGNSCANAAALIPNSGTINIGTINGSIPTTGNCYTYSQANPNANWWAFTPTQNGVLDITTVTAQNASTVDTRISIFNGTCAALTCYTGNDNVSTTDLRSDLKDVILAAGTTYYFVFDDKVSDNAAVNFYYEFTPQTCFRPTSVTAQAGSNTETTYQVDWTGPSIGDTTPDFYTVQIGPEGYTVDTASAIQTYTNLTGNTGTLTGLTPSTVYDMYIKSNCTPTDASVWWGPFKIMTEFTAVNPTYSETFDSTASLLFSGWSRSGGNNSTTWRTYTVGPNSFTYNGTNAIYSITNPVVNTPTNVYAYSRKLNLVSGQNYNVSYYTRQVLGSGVSTFGFLQVNYVPNADYTNTATQTQINALTVIAADAYFNQNHNFTVPTSGEYRIAFRNALQRSSTSSTTATAWLMLDNVVVSTVLSVNEFEKFGLISYPNPVLDFITIQNPENIQINKYSVIDLNGRTLQNNVLTNDNLINLTSLSKGIYFIQLDTEKGTLSKKIIKE